jgi:parvulin-like peptidyl-prolyl isomerase
VENINDNQTQKRPRKDVSGTNNPMYGRRHSTQSREKMSQAATLRNQQYRDALRNQHHVTMDEFLSANPSVKEYIKVLAQSVIKEEIDKLVWRKQNQRIQIPNNWE